MDSAKLPITGPCPIDLDAIGFDRSSTNAHCTHCEKGVQNLSTMTEAEAKAYLRSVAGQKVCVSYARDATGTVRFRAPEPAPVVPVARLRVRRAAAATLPALGLAAAMAACTPIDHPDVRKPPVAQHEQTSVRHHEVPPEMVAGGMQVPDEMVEGKMEVPEPVELVDGEMIAPDVEMPDVEMIEGEIEPEAIDDEPCGTAISRSQSPQAPTKKGKAKDPERRMDALEPADE